MIDLTPQQQAIISQLVVLQEQDSDEFFTFYNEQLLENEDLFPDFDQVEAISMEYGWA